MMFRKRSLGIELTAIEAAIQWEGEEILSKIEGLRTKYGRKLMTSLLALGA